MRSKRRLFWFACAWQAASLLCAGCSDDTSTQPAETLVSSAVVEIPVVSQASAELDVPVNQEPPVAEETSAEKVPASVLAWDAFEKSRRVNEGEGPVLFQFQMKNVSREPVVLEKITASCGCTTVDSRLMPYTIAPGSTENITISMSLAGKFGTVTKSLLVHGSHATWTLLVTSEIVSSADEILVPGVPNGAGMSAGVRGRNIGLAKANRQAVFKGDCAACHSRPAERQLGYGVYLGACAICHDAKHRASMVPDLRAAGMPHDAAYWREHITDGIDGTLMPAFAKEKGGILSAEQIDSLVKFLVETPLQPLAAGR